MPNPKEPLPDFSNVRSGGSSPNAKGPRPDFSDVKSGSSSSAATSETDRAVTYTVQKGDSLSKIAKEQYGDGNRWKAIFEANRDQITNPDLIHPGQVLKIPSSGDITP
jgi:nucleoid-associated protein YgaU